MAVAEYLQQFYNNPTGLDEYKINVLKNYYYPYIKEKIDVSRENLLIGITRNIKYIYFSSKINPELQLIYDKENRNFYIKFIIEGDNKKQIKFLEKLYPNEKYKNYLDHNNIKNSCNCNYCIII